MTTQEFLSDQLCVNSDDYVKDRPHWIAELSDGSIVYQDDERPGVGYHPSAWIRLRAYLKESQTLIKRLYLRNRSHVETPLPDNQLGYYFSHQAMSAVGITPNWRDSFTGTLGFFILGHIDRESKQLIVQRWKVPELQKALFPEGYLKEIRHYNKEDLGLILNDKSLG